MRMMMMMMMMSCVICSTEQWRFKSVAELRLSGLAACGSERLIMQTRYTPASCSNRLIIQEHNPIIKYVGKNIKYLFFIQ